MLDSHGRNINYLRLAVTDRCNLRCFYCMPEEGIDYVDRKDLLSYEEMFRLCRILSSKGISKLRITGGEPFVRKGLIEFLQKVTNDGLFSQIHITTNGVLTEPYLNDLWEMGIRDLNISLDTLDPERFRDITRRDKFDAVMNTLMSALELDFRIKVNMVVMNGRNIEDIASWVKFIQHYPVEVRFIEEMPFNGTGTAHREQFWSHNDILEHLRKLAPDLKSNEFKHGETAQKYTIEGAKGSLGIIAAYSRTFCGSCNRIRITPQGDLKTCLYDKNGTNFRDIIRGGISDDRLAGVLTETVQGKYIDGFEAEQDRTVHDFESMASIGG